MDKDSCFLTLTRLKRKETASCSGRMNERGVQNWEWLDSLTFAHSLATFNRAVASCDRKRQQKEVSHAVVKLDGLYLQQMIYNKTDIKDKKRFFSGTQVQKTNRVNLSRDVRTKSETT